MVPRNSSGRYTTCSEYLIVLDISCTHAFTIPGTSIYTIIPGVRYPYVRQHKDRPDLILYTKHPYLSGQSCIHICAGCGICMIRILNSTPTTTPNVRPLFPDPCPSPLCQTKIIDGVERVKVEDGWVSMRLREDRGEGERLLEALN